MDFIFDENKDDKNVFHHEVQFFDKQTQKLFATIPNYSDEEYEESLKVYRDLKNVIDTAFGDGVAEGFIP